MSLSRKPFRNINLSTQIKNLFGVIFFIFGLLIYKDYGVSMDEPIERLRGISSTIEFAKFFNIQNLLNWKTISENIGTDFFDGYFGAFFEYTLIIIEYFLYILFGDLSTTFSFQFRHLFSLFIFSFIGINSFITLINLRFNNATISILACLLLVLSPRIFAHAFYDLKDIGFLSFNLMCVVFVIKLIEKPNFKYIFLTSLITAICINIRTIAILNVLIALIFMPIFIKKNNKNASKLDLISPAFLYLVLTAIFTFILWPWLWKSPLDNFLIALSSAANLTTQVVTLFLGSQYPAKEVPFYYLPVWILISTPIIYFPFFIAGIFLTISTLMKSPHLHNFDNHKLIDAISLTYLIIPMSLATLLHTPMFDGWRHYYFTYPFFIYFIATALNWCLFHFPKKYYFKSKLIIVFVIGYLAFTIIYYHPYQHSFFNVLAGTNLKDKFDIDYWGLSTKQALELIQKKSKLQFYKIFISSDIKVDATLKTFNQLEKQKFLFVDRAEDSDFIITNFRNDKFNLKNYSNKFSVLYVEKKFGEPIFTLYENNLPHAGSIPITRELITFCKNCSGEKYLLGIGAAPYLNHGWSYPEAWGVWAEGSTADIVFPSPNSFSPKQLILTVSPFIPFGGGQQSFDLLLNGVKQLEMTLKKPGETIIEVPLSTDIIQNPFLLISLQFKNRVSPNSLGIGDDMRLLSLSLISARFN